MLNQTSLTYFEYSTLAAIYIFCQKYLDLVILEVGMGGRLDAVNAFDADIALITPISLDHTMWLGNNSDEISAEKAGIIRSNKPVVCSESSPAKSILDHVEVLNAMCFIAKRDFFIEKNYRLWSWHNETFLWQDLPR